MLAKLMAADGFDTQFGSVSPSAWTSFTRTIVKTLGLAEGDSLFEVGCGAGAFLYPLRDLGIQLSGLDRSAALIEAARKVFPDGEFMTGEATSLPTSPKADAVVSCGVFFYFSDLEYAERVIEAMVAKARKAVAILDVPDLSLRDVALADRIAAFGGERSYAERYAGLEHQYYDRGWLSDRLTEAGLQDVRVESQDIPEYANGRYRFNVWGFVP